MCLRASRYFVSIRRDADPRSSTSQDIPDAAPHRPGRESSAGGLPPPAGRPSVRWFREDLRCGAPRRRAAVPDLGACRAVGRAAGEHRHLALVYLVPFTLASLLSSGA